MELIFSLKNTIKDVSVSYFDRRAQFYLSDSLRWPWSWLRASEAVGIDKMMGDIAGLNVLDLGCGVGYYARRFVDKNPRRLFAVDISVAMINQITDSRIESRVGDAAQIKIDENFDRIISAGLLEFVDNAKAVLTNARNHINDKGWLILLVPRNNLAGWAYRFFHKRNGIGISLYDLSQLRELAADSGWAVVNYEFVFPFSLVIAFETTENPF